MEKKKLVSRAEIKKFIKENELKTIGDVQNVLKDLFAETLQERLETELDTTLGYEKNDVQNKQTVNRRNAYFGHIRTPIPVASGQHNGHIRTPCRDYQL